MLESWLPILRDLGVAPNIQHTSEDEFVEFFLDGDPFAVIARMGAPQIFVLQLEQPLNFEVS